MAAVETMSRRPVVVIVPTVNVLGADRPRRLGGIPANYSLEGEMSNGTVNVDRELIAEAITDQIEQSSDLSKREKRRATRVMNGRFRWQQRARRQVIDKAVEELLAEELIVPTEDGVEAAVDWESILGFLKEFLPVLLQIISLFG